MLQYSKCFTAQKCKSNLKCQRKWHMPHWGDAERRVWGVRDCDFGSLLLEKIIHRKKMTTSTLGHKPWPLCRVYIHGLTHQNTASCFQRAKRIRPLIVQRRRLALQGTQLHLLKRNFYSAFVTKTRRDVNKQLCYSLVLFLISSLFKKKFRRLCGGNTVFSRQGKWEFTPITASLADFV